MSNTMTHYKYMAHLENVHANLRNLGQVLQGLQLQSDLKASFEKFGLTKGTWMAIQHIPAARALFTEVPSLESLDAIGRTDVALKPTKVSKSAVIADWLDNTADGVNNFITTSKYHLDGLYKSIDDGANGIEESGSVDESKVVYALPAQQREEQCQHLKMAYDFLRRVEPGNINEDDLESAREHLSHVNGMCKMGYDNVPGPAGMYCVEDLEEGTLGELGYTYDGILDISDEVCDLLEDALSLITRRGDLLASQLADKAQEVRDMDDTPNETEEPIEDEAEPSQEDGMVEHVNLMTEYVSTIVCHLDCIGHIALNTLAVVSEAQG